MSAGYIVGQVFGIVLMLGATILATIIYLTPTILAFKKDLDLNIKLAIMVFNALLGWTVVFWLLCLLCALFLDKQE